MSRFRIGPRGENKAKIDQPGQDNVPEPVRLSIFCLLEAGDNVTIQSSSAVADISCLIVLCCDISDIHTLMILQQNFYRHHTHFLRVKTSVSHSLWNSKRTSSHGTWRCSGAYQFFGALVWWSYFGPWANVGKAFISHQTGLNVHVEFLSSNDFCHGCDNNVVGLIQPAIARDSRACRPRAGDHPISATSGEVGQAGHMIGNCPQWMEGILSV